MPLSADALGLDRGVPAAAISRFNHFVFSVAIDDHSVSTPD
jgi:hypothetical protein